MKNQKCICLGQTIALIYPGSFFSENLSRILGNVRYKLALHAINLDRIDLEALQSSDRLVFLTRGPTADRVVETVRSIRDRLPSAHILVMGAREPRDVRLALEAGADGFLRDNLNFSDSDHRYRVRYQDEAMLSAVETPAGGGNIRECEIRTKDDQRTLTVTDGEDAEIGGSEIILPYGRLSARERSILIGLTEGVSNKVIAQRLLITEATVKVHVKAIFRKIRVKNRTQAAVWAVKALPLKNRPPAR